MAFTGLVKSGRIRFALLVIFLILLVGVSGYRFIEGYGFLDSLYMTIITVATVGFKEVQPLSDAGKVFTILLIISSWGVFAYALTVLTTHLIEGEFQSYFKLAKTKANIKKMQNHVIVVGFGRNGQQAVEDLLLYGQPLVVIEKDHDLVLLYQSNSLIMVEGDATEDDVLLEAGVKTAKALITTLPIDADNLFVALSARSINPGLKIISRASSESTEGKLFKAGVNNVVMPEKVGGEHMASLVMKPDVVEFINHISVKGSDENNLEEIMCNALPDELMNKSISDLDIRAKTGANIVGFKTSDGRFIINPSPETRMTPGAKLFVLGNNEQITSIKALFTKKLK